MKLILFIFTIFIFAAGFAAGQSVKSNAALKPEAFLFYKNMVVMMGNETLTMAGSESGKTVRRRYTKSG